MEYWLNHVILDIKVQHASLLTLLLIIVFSLAVLIKEKKRTLDIISLIWLQEIFVSILLAMWIFNIFYLHFALLIWITLYFVLSILFRKNRVVLYLAFLYEHEASSLTARQLRLCSELFKPIKLIDCQKQNPWELRSCIYDQVRLYCCDKKINWLFPIRVYLAGVAFPVIREIIYGSQYIDNTSILFVSLENYTAMIALLYLLYPVLFFATVANKGSFLYNSRRVFKGIFIVISIIMLVIFTGITLN